jgi:hypothetical protein
MGLADSFEKKCDILYFIDTESGKDNVYLYQYGDIVDVKPYGYFTDSVRGKKQRAEKFRAVSVLGKSEEELKYLTNYSQDSRVRRFVKFNVEEIEKKISNNQIIYTDLVIEAR